MLGETNANPTYDFSLYCYIFIRNRHRQFLKRADLPHPEKREYRAVLALYELRA